MGEKIKTKNKKENIYPSAEMLTQACYEDYARLIETYDKIYEKVNIALAFCGIVLLVILGSVDYTAVSNICKTQSNLEMFSLLIYLFCSMISSVCIVWAVIQLLLLMRSREVAVFDSIDIRNEEIYRWKPEKAAVWLIDKYTIVTNDLRTVISEKQSKYDSTITKMVIIIEKGM